MNKLYIPLILLFFSSLAARAQYNPTYYRTISVTEPHNVAETNFPVLIQINTANLITSNHMQIDGDDIRFSLSSVAPPTSTLNYYIENGINTSTTRIWVNLPSLAASATATIYMFYGDPAATGVSSFSSTFPNAVITSGPNITLSGTQNIGWLQINANDTVFVTAGSPLTILAEKIIINSTGSLSGVGKGYQAPTASAVGTGTGGGGTSTSAGCGGGSYAGVGGTGGLDAGDTPGTGPTYGTATGTDIDMGSSGGTATGIGGSGGGAITIYSNEFTINGEVNVSGAPGNNGSRAGGGGAGGGIKVHAAGVSGTGMFAAKGGSGGVGTSTANDSGGGGGGGRVKLEYGALTGPTLDVAGGIGGPYGGQAPGQPGGAGSIYSTSVFFDEPFIGPEITTPLSVVLTNISAKPTGSKVLIDWSTGSENEPILFHVQRSGNGSDFVNIATLTSQGNTSNTTNYQHSDLSPSQGRNYYRLKMEHADNNAFYSKTVQVNCGVVPGVTLSQRVVGDELTVRSTQPATVLIISATGQNCGVYNINGETHINVDGLATGQYMLKVINSDLVLSFQKK